MKLKVAGRCLAPAGLYVNTRTIVCERKVLLRHTRGPPAGSLTGHPPARAGERHACIEQVSGSEWASHNLQDARRRRGSSSFERCVTEGARAA